jgi:hypothetical protein
MKDKLNRDKDGKYIFTDENFHEFFFYMKYYTDRKIRHRSINIRAEYRRSFARKHGYKFKSQKTRTIVRSFLKAALRNSALNQNTGKLRIYYIGTVKFYVRNIPPGRWYMGLTPEGEYKYMKSTIFDDTERFSSVYKPHILPSNSKPRFFINLSTSSLRYANRILYDSVEHRDIFPRITHLKFQKNEKIYNI